MHQDQLYNRLAYLEEQKSTIEKEIMLIKHDIEKLSPFSKADKITLFHKLFIGNELAYAKHWVSKDGMEAIMYLQCGDIVHESVRKNTMKHTLKTITTQYETFLDHFTMMLGEITEDEL
jgi:hypothetical protein